ncbi:MAG: sigma-70 family RNA polymerase sigma factor [Planctomycetaceae bacterium]
MTEHDSDTRLIQRSVEGDVDAFTVLVRRYEERLTHSLEHALGSRDDALDAAQSAFVTAWRKLSTFRQESAFYSWLYRVAMNAAISRRRKQRISTVSLDQQTVSAGNQAQDDRPDASPDHRMTTAEQIELIRSELGKLNEEFRQPLVLKEIDGMTYEQISEVLNIPIGTVRSRIFRARQELTERLKRLMEDG